MNGHPIRAFLLAPLAPPMVLWAVLEPKLSTLPYMLSAGGYVSYLAAFIGGLPIYLFIRARWELNVVHTLVASAVVGAVALSLAATQRFDVEASGLGAGLGAIAGIAFWLLWRERGSAKRGRGHHHRPGQDGGVREQGQVKVYPGS